MKSEKLINKWKQYRYRFVPWLMMSLKNRAVRTVTENSADIPLVAQDEFVTFLHSFLETLHRRLKETNDNDIRSRYEAGLQVQQEVSGYSIDRQPSNLPDGGTGVKVVEGTVPKASITSLYPGLIYEVQDPIFFQSIKNPFIFRCADGILIDGNDKGLSKSLYKSCRGRDSCWPIPACDESWMTATPQCPLNIGQYVNNHTKKYPANVAYQEYYVPEDFPMHLKQYLPNNFYTPSSQLLEGTSRVLRVVALVSIQEISKGDEIFSSYFTLVR